MTRFVLVPGGWHGGWVYDKVADALVDDGHDVHALTLPGLGDDSGEGVNLDAHIDAVLRALGAGDAPAVLVGHSYGGMVITGAADREPSLVSALVYVDAYVPDDGATVWALTSQRYRDVFVAGATADGLACAVPAHLDARCRPHPLATLLQAIRLTGRWREVARKAFVVARGWNGSPFIELHARLRSDPAWTTYELDCAHDVARLAPEALTRILLEST